jgi:ubiquinol oxidase
MEDLGGADRWLDRFIAQHVAVTYYWIVFFVYLYNPTIAYNLNQVVEEHAFATYDQFLRDNGEELKKLPAPQIAKDYYHGEDLYMFDDFQTGTCEVRRPEIRNLYDVFVAIRDDEGEHVKTMTYLQTDQELSNVHDGTCLVPEEEDVLFWAGDADEQLAVTTVSLVGSARQNTIECYFTE